MRQSGLCLRLPPLRPGGPKLPPAAPAATRDDGTVLAARFDSFEIIPEYRVSIRREEILRSRIRF